MTLNRGDVALVRFPHTAGTRGKKRPVVVVQADVYNAKARHVIVAEVTKNLADAGDPAHLLIDVSTPDGQATGHGTLDAVAAELEVPLEELPPLLRSLISEADESAAREWWGRLATAERQALLAAYDERWEACFFGPTPDGHTAPAVLGGRFLPDDDAWRFDEWEADWREYLVEHPVTRLSSMFRSSSWLTVEGVLNIWVEWGRTRFEDTELPPSEQHAR